MMKSGTSDPWMSLTLLLNRLALGALFVYAGVFKIRGGVKNFVEGFYAQATPSWLPKAFALPYGYALPWLEALAGVLLIVGLGGRIGAALASLLLLSILIATGVKDPNGGPFTTNVILFTLTLLLTTAGSGAFSLDTLMGRKKS
jgi:uncharacterized membrane protein YphA (DoxX/SURF4 family)